MNRQKFALSAAASIFMAMAANAAVIGARPDLVADVASGKIKEAKASWWGFDPVDATEGLQAAINSRVPVLHVDAFAGPWIVRPLHGVSNQKIIFDNFVEVRAKKGEFLGLNDCLLKYENASNIVLSGKNAVLRMNRWDYHAAPYRKGEWRHCISLLGCTDVLIEGLTVAESGGDGIYVSTSKTISRCRRVTIRDCVCEKNYRQGISVISAEDLLIERTVMRDTKGTAPAAGIDFEPNLPGEVLKNCVMRDCVSENNQGDALEVYVGQFDKDTEPISIRVQNCRLIGGKTSFWLGSGTGHRKNGYVRGIVGLENCLLERANGPAIFVRDNPADAVRVAFANCVVRDSNAKRTTPGPEVMLGAASASIDVTDGLIFRNVRIAQAEEHPWINKIDCTYRRKGVENISGDIVLETPSGLRREILDAKWLRNYFGAADPDLPKTMPPAYDGQLEVSDAHAGEVTDLAGFRVRSKARYGFYAEKPMKVTLKGQRAIYGKPETGDWKVTRATDGREIAHGAMPGATPTDISFDVPAAGFYVFEPGLAGRHGFVLTSANVPVAIEVPEGGAPFIAGGASGYVHVTGERRFFVLANAADSAEFLSAGLCDPSGKEVWKDSQIESASGWKSSEKPMPGFWKVTTGRPARGCFEDHSLTFGGIPGWLFLSPDRRWIRLR